MAERKNAINPSVVKDRSCEELLELAWQSVDNDDKDSAIRLLEECLSIQPNHPVVLRQLGLYYWGSRNDPEKARQLLERCIEVCDDVDAHFFLAHAYESLGWIDKAKAEYVVALEWYENQMKEKKDEGMQLLVHTHYASFLAVNFDFKSAEDQFKKALSIDPNFIKAQEGYAELKRCMSQDSCTKASKTIPPGERTELIKISRSIREFTGEHATPNEFR